MYKTRYLKVKNRKFLIWYTKKYDKFVVAFDIFINFVQVFIIELQNRMPNNLDFMAQYEVVNHVSCLLI